MDAATIIRDSAKAAGMIAGEVLRTPLLESGWLGRVTGARVLCKMENLQHTGSFKLRGALSRVLSLNEDEVGRGVVTASTGNHGLAVAWAARTAGAGLTVFVPENIDPSKLDKLESYGADIVQAGSDNMDTEIAAREWAGREGRVYVSPYNDEMVVAGQGTVALEMIEDGEPYDAVFASVGGGGLISGIAGCFKASRKATEVIGCSPANSPVMARSVEAGRIIEMESLPTLSDATAGGIEPGAVTFDICRRLVDRFVTVDEDAIGEAVTGFLENEKMLIEGAAGVTVAGLVASGRRYEGCTVGLVICGGNIGLGRLRELI